MRQRIRLRSSPLRFVGRALVVLLALALVWYGLMVVLLAVKVSPSTVNSISGYRSAYDYLAGLGPDDVDGTVRAIVAGAGLLAFLLFGWLATRELPRPYLARHEVELHADDHGEVTVEPRAVERAAEIAACRHPSVLAASGRYATDGITLSVTLRRAREAADSLREVQQRAVASLSEHGLPTVPVDVTLAHFDRKTRRELQ